MSDAHKVVIAEAASLLLGIVEGHGACDNPFANLENDKTGLDDC